MAYDSCTYIGLLRASPRTQLSSLANSIYFGPRPGLGLAQLPPTGRCWNINQLFNVGWCVF